jgi:hypothetical protein
MEGLEIYIIIGAVIFLLLLSIFLGKKHLKASLRKLKDLEYRLKTIKRTERDKIPYLIEIVKDKYQNKKVLDALIKLRSNSKDISTELENKLQIFFQENDEHFQSNRYYLEIKTEFKKLKKEKEDLVEKLEVSKQKYNRELNSLFYIVSRLIFGFKKQ